MFGFYTVSELLLTNNKRQQKKIIISSTKNSIQQIISATVIIGIINQCSIVMSDNIINNNIMNQKEKIKEILLLNKIENNFLELLYNIIMGIKKQDIQSIQIISYLDTMKTILDKENIVSLKILKKKEIENLNYIKQKYPTDKDINKLVNQIIKRLNSYDVNPLLVKKNNIIK